MEVYKNRLKESGRFFYLYLLLILFENFNIDKNTKVETASKITNINKEVNLRNTSENNSLPNIIPTKKPEDISIISAFLILFRGKDILNSKSNPV